MTSTAPPAPAVPAPLPPVTRRAGFGHTMLGEWTKIRSVRLRYQGKYSLRWPLDSVL